MSTTVKVWDPLVRIFHWSLVAAFFIAYVLEDEWMGLHRFAGYTVLTIVLLRIVWGLVGTRYARFSDFVRGPQAVMAYLRSMVTGRPQHFVGHNPAGGAMIIALLLSLLATSLTGLAVYGAEGEGLLAGWSVLMASGEEMLEETHEFFANFTLLLVVVHVTGVALGSLVHRENLVRSMWNGRKTID